MDTHVPLGLWIAVPTGIAIFYGLIAVTLLRRAGGRPVLLVLTEWPVAFSILAAAGAFTSSYNQAVPTIAFGIAVPIVVGVVFFLRSGALRRTVDAIPPQTLIAVQIYRVIGGLFIVAWALGRMPAIFALPAGIGDLLVGFAAPLVAAVVAGAGGGDDAGAGGMAARSRRIAVAWNIAGIVDLVVAVAMGASTSPSAIYSPLLGHANPLITRLPFVLIPVFLVPLSILLHLATLRRLGAPERERPPVDEGRLRRGMGAAVVR